MESKKTNRRDFLKSSAAVAGGLTLGSVAKSVHAQTPTPPAPGPEAQIPGTPELVAYGKRSKYVTSVRIPHGGRPSPDQFGLDFHIATPLQDQTGVIAPTSLHYVGTTRGSYVPEINPDDHRLMIHGMVDNPLIYTLDELKRFPSVTRLHFIECAGNRANGRHVTVQETHGMTSCAEWTGVLLSTLLEEAGVQEGASWIVAEGVEEIKGASSLPLSKAMEDILICYGMNGEAVRPQQGYPLRLLAPGFEGILSVKWLRRIKVVDQFYMTYNDYGHLRQDAEGAALSMQVGPKSVITYPSGGQQLAGTGYYEIRGLAWSGGGRVSRVEISMDGGQSWVEAELRGEPQPKAHTQFRLDWEWDGSPCELQSRCIDELGSMQASRQEIEQYWADRGEPARVKGLDNSIQPWRIEGDGSVHNAIS